MRPSRSGNAPIWIAVYAGVFAALVAAHHNLLRLPYYWDEAGYYIPAAYDFFRIGTLIPHSTLSNAHPPLPSLWLAAWWKLFGFSPLVTRVAVASVAALGILAVYRLSRNFIDARGAIAVALLTAVYPVWFAQSTLAHADIFAAAATLWALSLLTRRVPNVGGAVALFCIAVLSKETAVITPVALAGWEAFEFFRLRRNALDRRIHARRAALLFVPVLPLSLWYLYHWHETGFIFGNPEYLRYNAQGTFHAARICYALVERFWHVTGHMEMFVPSILTLALWLLPKLPGVPEAQRQPRNLLIVAFVANLLAFSVVGGALLTRYLLPLYPLVLLFYVSFWQGRTRRWAWAAAVTAIVFVIGWTAELPYRFAAEDNLSYRDAIIVQQQAIAVLLAHNPHPVVVTAWPVSDYLAKPELGYVSAPVQVIPVADFSLEPLLTARTAGGYNSALLFSLKDPPAPARGPLSRTFEKTNQQYFGDHSDLPPVFAARLLGGELIWQGSQRRKWAAVMVTDAPVNGRLQKP
jgi:4-amino-4-deoxy-L-arabinose transferase-like glycosyltransferase